MVTSNHSTYQSARATITNAANLHGIDLWERCIAINTALDSACKSVAAELTAGRITGSQYRRIETNLSRLAARYTI